MSDLAEYLVAGEVRLPDGTREQRHWRVYEPDPQTARETVVETWAARGFATTEEPTVAVVTEPRRPPA